MRTVASLTLISLFLATTLEGAVGKDKVKNVCKRAEFSGLELEVCVPEQSNPGSEIICTVTATYKSKKPIGYVRQGATLSKAISDTSRGRSRMCTGTLFPERGMERGFLKKNLI